MGFRRFKAWLLISELQISELQISEFQGSGFGAPEFGVHSFVIPQVGSSNSQLTNLIVQVAVELADTAKTVVRNSRVQEF